MHLNHRRKLANQRQNKVGADFRNSGDDVEAAERGAIRSKQHKCGAHGNTWGPDLTRMDTEESARDWVA